MFCSQCGQQIADDAKFCMHCGAKVATGTGSSFAASGTIPPASISAAPGHGETIGPASLEETDRVLDDLSAGSTISGAALRSGQVLAGRYEIQKRLGSGGMGEVWQAVDTQLGFDVALKVLPPLLAHNSRAVAALKREATVLLRLTHANICRLYNFHSDDHIGFLVMELIDGPTLEQRLDDCPDRRLSLSEAIPVFGQIAAALDLAHGRTPPILHRDIKPANIMIGSDGEARLTDFGIAREMRDSMTRATGQEATGTLLYMSPEQFQGRPLTPASDVYSLTASFYEALVGNPPFHSGAIGHQLLNSEPVSPREHGIELPEHVEAALLKGLAKQSADRFATCTELIHALTIEPVQSAAPPATEPAQQEPPETTTLHWCSTSDSPVDEATTPAAGNDPADQPESLLINSIGMEFKSIPAGSFMMGDEDGRSSDRPHPVTLSKSFELGTYPVTQQQYEAVMGANPSRFKHGDGPVENVNWDDAMEFCHRLSQRPEEQAAGHDYRLPTEAEWEYACRAGTTTKYSFGSDETLLAEYAWYGVNSGDRTQLVGQKLPNPWGLHDMLGNVWEWCEDLIGPYPINPATDPTGPATGTGRIRRGGSWSNGSGQLGSGHRLGMPAERRLDTLGFRVVRIPGNAVSGSTERRHGMSNTAAQQPLIDSNAADDDIVFASATEEDTPRTNPKRKSSKQSAGADQKKKAQWPTGDGTEADDVKVTVQNNSTDKVHSSDRYWSDSCRGLLIRVRFATRSARPFKGHVTVIATDEHGTPLRDVDGHCCDNHGYVCVSSTFQGPRMPAAAASTRHDLSLFLPNRQLHLQPGNHRIRLLVEVSTGRSIEPLVRHQTDLFTINSPGWSRSTLVDILNERFHAVGNTYIGSAIPERKLTAVQSLHAASLKRGESICLIYDGTVFGSAKDGFAITTAGVAWKENIGCDPGYATFNQLSPETIVADDSYLNMCGLGKGYVYPSDVSAAESALRGVLADIQVARKKSGNTAP